MKNRAETLSQRNARVDVDKAWKTSKTRRAAIALLTYLVVVAFLYAIHLQHPWINGLVPVIGFILSTLAIAPLKQWWLRSVYRR